MKNFLLLTLFFSVLRAEKSALETKFYDVLLVVHYNHPHYDSMLFIRQMYTPIFPNIVFYGETTFDGVYYVDSREGWFFSRVVADVFKRFPGYRGYLFLQDDCFMNFWNYQRLDKDKIWFQVIASNEFIHEKLDRGLQTSWWWFNDSCGLDEVNRIFPNLTNQEKRTLFANHGQDHIVGGMADMFYIPSRLPAPQIIRLCELFENVFLEISIPTLLSCIENVQNWQKLNMLWTGQSERTLDLYNADSDWVHPLKFSSKKNREFALNCVRKYWRRS